MTDRKNMSIMELAYQILLDNEKAMTFIELFDLVCTEKDISEEDKAKMISQVYTDFISSAKFIYVGDDEWDVKGRQAIDLWDKDGAYYDEYHDYEEELSLYNEAEVDEYSIPEEPDEEEEPSPYEDDFDEDNIEDEETSEYDAFIEDDEDYIEDEEEISIASEIEDEEEETDKDFDDEEYNEYMDDYEGMYED